MVMSVMSLMWILIRKEVADLDPGGKKSPKMRQTSAENSKKNCIKLAIKFKIYFIKAKCNLIKKILHFFCQIRKTFLLLSGNF